MDRIERHDLINAVGLAAVLFAMALALVFGAGKLLDTVSGDGDSDGIVSATKPEETIPTSSEPDAPTTVPTTSTTIALPHPNGEVKVTVANAASRSGVAGAGTAIMASAGYDTLAPKNASPSDTSIIYYLEGYKPDAEQAARLLEIPEFNVAPMIDDTGVEKTDAMLVVVLGADTTVR